MKHTAIVYSSVHHKNTEKLVESIGNKYNITLIDANETSCADLSEFDLIGFASGIDFGKFYDSVINFLINNLPENKAVFFMYTCRKNNHGFTDEIKAEAVKKNAVLMGEYGCKGYNTYGPLKFIGGINRKHPTQKEIKEAMEFFEAIAL